MRAVLAGRSAPRVKRVGVSRSNLVERLNERPKLKKRIGRPPLPDDELVAAIKAVIAEMPTYGYRQVHASSSGKP
jgi:putative transposase